MFRDSSNQVVTAYTINVGQGTKKGTPLFQLIATDPDADVLRFGRTNDPLLEDILPLDPNFRVTLGGTIEAARDFKVGEQVPRAFKVSVVDGHGGVAYATMTVNFVPLVSLSGDLFGVKQAFAPNKQDNIRLDFVRTTPNNQNELEVRFTIDWQTVTTAGANPDVTNAATIPTVPGQPTYAGLPYCKVIIPANQIHGWIDINVSHLAPANGEKRKYFEVTVRDYDPTKYISNSNAPSAEQGGYEDLHGVTFIGAYRQRAFILPAITLFAGFNDDLDLRDPAGKRSDPNDMKQGLLGDCGPLTMLASFTQNEPALTAKFQQQPPTGAIKFTFSRTWNGATPTAPVDVFVDPVLATNGKNQALLTWDYETDPFTGINSYEIWVQVYERAYDMYLRQVEHRGVNTAGKDPAKALTDWTGKESSVSNLLTRPRTAQGVTDLTNEITAAFAANKPIYLVTVAPKWNGQEETFEERAGRFFRSSATPSPNRCLSITPSM